MKRHVAQGLIIIGLASMGGGVAMADETYGPTSQRVRVAEASKMPLPRPTSARAEEDMEYHPLVQTPQKQRLNMQPGDVAVQWNGPKMKVSLGL